MSPIKISRSRKTVWVLLSPALRALTFCQTSYILKKMLFSNDKLVLYLNTLDGLCDTVSVFCRGHFSFWTPNQAFVDEVIMSLVKLDAIHEGFLSMAIFLLIITILQLLVTIGCTSCKGYLSSAHL